MKQSDYYLLVAFIFLAASLDKSTALLMCAIFILLAIVDKIVTVCNKEKQ